MYILDLLSRAQRISCANSLALWSLHSLNSFSHVYAKDFVGVGFGNSPRFREFLQTPSLVLSGPGSPKGKNGCLKSRLDLVSITLYYLGCSNSSDDVGS